MPKKNATKSKEIFQIKIPKKLGKKNSKKKMKWNEIFCYKIELKMLCWNIPFKWQICSYNWKWILIIDAQKRERRWFTKSGIFSSKRWKSSRSSQLFQVPTNWHFWLMTQKTDITISYNFSIISDEKRNKRQFMKMGKITKNVMKMGEK